jgi:hypothetical protein
MSARKSSENTQLPSSRKGMATGQEVILEEATSEPTTRNQLGEERIVYPRQPGSSYMQDLAAIAVRT